MTERRIEQRAGKFTEKLSLFMSVVAALGGFVILLEPKFGGSIFGHPFSIGNDFSAELKGAVVTIMLIGGWTAVKEFWLGQSHSGEKQSESMSRIAEASAPVAAAAVAAASSPAQIKADDVTVAAQGDVTVNGTRL